MLEIEKKKSLFTLISLT